MHKYKHSYIHIFVKYFSSKVCVVGNLGAKRGVQVSCEGRHLLWMAGEPQRFCGFLATAYSGRTIRDAARSTSQSRSPPGAGMEETDASVSSGICGWCTIVPGWVGLDGVDRVDWDGPDEVGGWMRLIGLEWIGFDTRRAAFTLDSTGMGRVRSGRDQSCRVRLGRIRAGQAGGGREGLGQANKLVRAGSGRVGRNRVGVGRANRIGLAGLDRIHRVDSDWVGLYGVGF